MRAWLAEKLLDATRLVRFGVVGLVATACYLALFNLVAVPIGLSGFEAHLLALSVSVFVSYAGHHAYTFRLAGGHALYLPKFLGITAFLFLLSSACAYALEHYARLPPVLISIAIVILYPSLSYLIHCLWTFGAARKPPHKAAAGP